jgi:hypothetical protein
MSAFFSSSSHLPCPECGASVPISGKSEHVCDPERLLDFRLFQLRLETAAFEGQLREFLESPRGRFEQWCAERERPAPKTPDLTSDSTS